MKIGIMISTLTTLLYLQLAEAELPTKLIIFNAYTQKDVLNPNLIVAQRYAGNCIARSIATPGRMDTWRCRASNMILDPCFEDTYSLACVVSPWSRKVAVLELNTPLVDSNKRKISTSGLPWAVELENGQRCTYLTGSSIIIRNQRVNYGCESYKYNIIGNLDRSTPTWKAMVYNYDNKSVDNIAITTAWF